MSGVRFGSVCSGIEAASVAFTPLGWSAAWFAEIDAAPSKLLAHHYPDVTNHGDMTKLPALIAAGEIEAPDVLCGGTPCQSWSVAGNRGGRNDPRGQLTFSFVEIIRAARPKWVVYENVPGILSAEGGIAFCQLLDEIQGLGYVVNADILDAQDFGLAQRRRRVFLACQRADILMSQRTTTSALIGATTVSELFQDILDARPLVSGRGRTTSPSRCESALAGLRRKTQPFVAHGGDLSGQWLRNLADFSLSAPTGPGSSELKPGPGTEMEMRTSASVGIGSLGSPGPYQGSRPKRSLSTSQLLSKCLEDLFSVASVSTTSTELKAITDQRICSFAEAVNIIGMFIARSTSYCPHSWKAASSFSTTLQKVIRYARQANREILCDTWVHGRWDDLLREAERTLSSLQCAREGFDPAQVLFEFEGVRRDSAPSRGAGQETAGALTASDGGVDQDSALIAHAFGGNRTSGELDVSTALTAHGAPRFDFASDTFIVEPTYSTKTHNTKSNQAGKLYEDYTVALDANSPPPVVFVKGTNPHSADEAPTFRETETAACLNGWDERHNPPKHLAVSGYTVRRLMPIECERLQGFPDGHSAAMGKDTPRYRALGNSWAVPVVRWIGVRIERELRGVMQ